MCPRAYRTSDVVDKIMLLGLIFRFKKCLSHWPARFRIGSASNMSFVRLSEGLIWRGLGWWLDIPAIVVRFPKGGKRVFFSPRSVGVGAHLAYFSLGTGGFLPGSEVAGAWSWPLTLTPLYAFLACTEALSLPLYRSGDRPHMHAGVTLRRNVSCIGIRTRDPSAVSAVGPDLSFITKSCATLPNLS